MLPELDDLGALARWPVRQRCRWRGDFRHTIDGVPTDITSITIEAHITADPESTTVLKSFTVSKPDAADGRWSIVVPAAAATLDPGEYWFSMQWNPDGAGEPEPLLSGPFIVTPWPWSAP